MAGETAETEQRYRTVLSIAGSDSGGGAGIQADIKTISALGGFAMTAITALTAQNTRGVTGIHPVPPEFAAAQIDAVLSDIGVDAVKIGMLYSAELIAAVARELTRHKAANIVVDPVMVAQSGDRLLQDEAVEALTAELFPLATVVTPNLPEAEVLLGRSISGPQEMEAAALALAEFGSRSVLIKGGHGESERSDDLLFLAEEDRMLWIEGRRIETKNTHGTGCTLSSAIAARLAAGEGIEGAVQKAKAYLTEALRAGAGYRFGRGHGPVHHFYRVWR
ncbi:MAG: bifunctional hydroxymethylpyrimidine kinase/phosphomethylpyrimidine kinase [Desulfobacterales bacterium]|nr:bifunctional hydroxymethylpyrimidine kinase/phosphomethylpyrimidine kinase [Desulfobacterales bacterium]